MHADKKYAVSKEKLVIDLLPDLIITGMNPPSGCPGTTITISGKGFLPYKKRMKVILTNNSSVQLNDREYDLVNITDNAAQFVLPDTTAMYNVFLKFHDGLIWPVTSTYTINKLLVGKDTEITFIPQFSNINDNIRLKMFYLGNSKPKVYFGKIEAQVTGYKPVFYQYRPVVLKPNNKKLDYYDGYIDCIAPKVSGPCKIRVVTDCGEINSSFEYCNIGSYNIFFKQCFAEVINLSAKMKQMDDAFTEPKFFVNTFPYYTKTLEAKHLISFKNNIYYFYLDDVKTDYEGNSNGMRYSYQFNLINRSAIIRFDHVSGSGAQHKTTTINNSSYEVSVINLKVIETDAFLIYYLNGNDLLNNITAQWNTYYYYRSNGMQRTVTEELVELQGFTDSTYIKLTLSK